MPRYPPDRSGRSEFGKRSSLNDPEGPEQIEQSCSWSGMPAELLLEALEHT